MNAISAKIVGILAAITIAEVGPASDVKAFFNLVAFLLENGVKYIEKNLNNDHLAWHGCEVALDIETLKTNIDFKKEN
ncbi:hypothetical protein C6560_16335 [Enterobacter sp. FS01]|nr:hypothetical protein C6560_16335 [Enterobacter sp. FS01]